MSKLNYTDAFAKYGAKLVNPRWAYSAIADDGSMVRSCPRNEEHGRGPA